MPSTADERRPLTEFTPTREVVVTWYGIGTGVGLVSTFLFAGIYAAATGDGTIGFRSFSLEGVAAAGIAVLALSAVVIVVHELVHAAVIRYYGGDVSFGVGLAQFVLPYAYVTTTHRLDRNRFVAVALAPLVVITLVGVPLMVLFEAPVLVVPLAVNAGGAIGDLWMVGILLRYPPHVVVEDSVTGLTVYGRREDRPLPPAPTRAFLRRIALGTGTGFGLLVLVALAAPIVLDVLGARSFTLGVPGTPWQAYTFEGGPDGFRSSVNVLGVLAVSVLLGVGFALVETVRRPAV